MLTCIYSDCEAGQGHCEKPSGIELLTPLLNMPFCITGTCSVSHCKEKLMLEPITIYHDTVKKL